MPCSAGGRGWLEVGRRLRCSAVGALDSELPISDVRPMEVGLGLLALLVMSVTLLATWLPARRATRVDPLVALRGE